jgi:hypothetical protein
VKSVLQFPARLQRAFIALAKGELQKIQEKQMEDAAHQCSELTQGKSQVPRHIPRKTKKG